MLTFYVILQCNKKLEKLPKLENFQQSITGSGWENPGPLERARSANQIQEFRIPERLEAGEKLS